MTVQDGVDELVRRYLAGFGPASIADVQSYTGLPRTTIAPALERLTLRRFRAESGDELLDVPRARCRTRRRPRRSASCRPGTPRCSSTRAAR
jgi:hypothetical protein